MTDWLATWKSTALFQRAFTELKLCMGQRDRIAADLLQTDADVPAEYRVQMAPIPARHYQLRHNLFSTLFQSVYHLLDVDRERRLVYGGINLCFRVWVTGADNLLDDEDKIVLPLEMPGNSRIMREVISIMAADRILYLLLEEAAAAGTLTRDEVTQLQMRSLQVLLPSAAQEASEEQGVTARPKPETVLATIHKLKTGLLFHLPFLGIDTIEHDIDPDLLRSIKAGLMDFGMGCQILDDIRDLSRDLAHHNNNYLLSQLYWQYPDAYAALVAKPGDPATPIHHRLPAALTAQAAAKGFGLMRQGLRTAFGQQLGPTSQRADRIALGMFDVLDLTELAATCQSTP